MTRKSKIRDLNDAGIILSNFAGKPVKIIILLISSILVILPFYWLFTSSIKLEQEYLANPPIIIPSKVTFDNFIEVFQNNDVGFTLYNSIYVSFFTMVITVLIGSLASFALVRGKLPKRANGIFLVWFLIQKMYPAIAIAIPVFLVMRNFGLIDKKLALIIMNTSFNIPLVLLIMIDFFRSIPHELEESAMIDGCSMWQRFIKIILPITKPGLIASAILTFVSTWNEFLFAVFLSVRDSKTLPVVVAGFITDRGLAWGPMAATSVTTIIPVVILVWILQKDFIRGLAMGAVKE